MSTVIEDLGYEYEKHLAYLDSLPENQPHTTTCRYCENGELCPTCGKELWCMEDMEWYDPDEPFKSTECKNYKCVEYPIALNRED